VILASSAIGHPAAIAPAAAIPAKFVHLLAGAIWTGGLLWIASADRAANGFVAGTRRVSSLALGSVALVVVAGVIEAVLFLPSLPALWGTTYGQLVLAKATGTAVLVAFGAYHRRLVAGIEADASRTRLNRSVRGELAVMGAVAVLGGILSYVSPRL
jgi:putative copper export protein